MPARSPASITWHESQAILSSARHEQYSVKLSTVEHKPHMSFVHIIAVTRNDPAISFESFELREMYAARETNSFGAQKRRISYKFHRSIR